jgi:large subunit ribosomal protein L25
MAERLTIVAETRSVTGKQVKQLRREGWIPAVIYGQGEPIHIQIERNPLRRALRSVGTTQLVELEVTGTPHTVLVREIQQHVARGDLLHVDFFKVDMRSTITSEAELVGVGQAKPAADGLGVAMLVLRSVEIECLPDDLVAEISVDLSQIVTPDDLIHVRDLVVPEGVAILTGGDEVVARFEYTQEATAEEEEEEELAPVADAVEVITKGKKEEEGF